MPKVDRLKAPDGAQNHIVARLIERGLEEAAHTELIPWLNTDPTVPDGPWFKRLPSMTVCGRGSVMVTVLEPTMAPFGTEL